MKLPIKIIGLLIAFLISGIIPSFSQSPEQLFQKGLTKEEGEGNLEEAIDIYYKIVENRNVFKSLQAKALLHVGFCYEKLGKEEATKVYHRLVNNFATQKNEVAIAQERLSYLGASSSDLIKKAQIHLKKGNELFRSWDYKSAIQEYKNAIKLVPNTVLAQNAQYCIGQSFFKTEQYDAALAAFESIVNNFPKSPIIPVTELMISQIKYIMSNSNNNEIIKNNSDGDTIVDEETGISYTKIKTFVGKNDLSELAPSSLSPNGKFLLSGNTVVPMDGDEPFKFVDMKVNDPLWSPDGGKIAFTKDTSLFVVPVSPQTGKTIDEARKLLSKDCNIYGINWSPDSKKLYYSILDYQKKNYPEIWFMSLADGFKKPIAIDSTMGLFPSCSPDGNTIAFRDMLTVYLCPSEGGTPKEFTKREKSFNPKWTPDGKWLYWDETRYGNSRMTFIRLSDKLEFKLNPPKRIGSYFTISQDEGKLLFYQASHELFWGIKVASVSGGPAYEPVAHLPAFGAWWTKDSKKIIVEDDPDLKLVPISGGESYRMELDLKAEGKPCHFDISPGNKYILFEVINKNEKGDLYIAPISIEKASIVGPAKKVIENWTYIGGYNTNLSWSSDGFRLAIIHNENIWIYNCDDNDLKQITKSSELKSWIAWSPDGTMLSYQESVDKPDHLSRIISSQDGKSIKAIKDALIWPYGWAPDSKSILYERDGSIVNHNIQSNEISIIINPKAKQLSWIPRYSWSPDGKYLILDARKALDPDKYYLYKMAVEGGTLTELASGDSDSFKYNIEWSPDGKWFCYCYMKMEKVRPESTLWGADFKEVVKKLSSAE